MIKDKHSKINKYKYLGAIHVHSSYSDGTGDINLITKAAKQAGLDFVIITDHNSFDIKEGFYNGICVIKGEEISPNGKNHYLAFGINNHIEANINACENIENVRNSGGFGFVAHPDETSIRKNSHKPIKWLDKNLIPDGIEIWNWFSQWADNLNDKNTFSLLISYLFKHKLVTAPYRKTMKWWDLLNNRTEEIIPAIGGIDAHALKIKKYIIPITVFPYVKMFKTITNVVSFDEPLSNDFEIRKNQILNAIKDGKNIIVNRHISKVIPDINISNTFDIAKAGEKIKLKDKTFLNVSIEEKMLIKIFHNGNEIKKEITKNLKMILDKVGKYRVEIINKNRGYTYSNPIVLY